MIITLDMGTTNMRLRLFSGELLLDELKLQLGVRNVVFTGDRRVLIDGIAKELAMLLKRNGTGESQISMIIACGMFGSDLGLCPTLYVQTPVTLEQLAEKSQRFIQKEITSIPFYVIPGVANACAEQDINHIDQMDMMRGEETEFFGLCCNKGCPSVTILPGSHTKIIRSDGNRILSCHTAMGGEMISAMGEHTVLKHSLPHLFQIQWDKKYLVKGYEYGKKAGVTKALFRIRVGDILCGKNIGEEQLAGFYIGAVLQEDIKAVAAVAGSKDLIAVGGSDPLKAAFGLLLEHGLSNKVVQADYEEAEFAGAGGALRIAQLIAGNSDSGGREKGGKTCTI